MLSCICVAKCAAVTKTDCDDESICLYLLLIEEITAAAMVAQLNNRSIGKVVSLNAWMLEYWMRHIFGDGNL